MRFHCIFQPRARNYAKKIESFYGNYSIEECDVILVLGGDGFMLRTLHKYNALNKPFYGVNFGHHGGLMNPKPDVPGLEHVIRTIPLFSFYPIAFTAQTLQGSEIKGIVFNEITIQRKKYIPIEFDLAVQQKKLLTDARGDGIVISTPLGSRAYNASARGPALDFSLECFIITPLNLFSPKGWNSHIIHPFSSIEVTLKKPGYRQTSLGADIFQYYDIKKISLRRSPQCIRVFFQSSLP